MAKGDPNVNAGALIEPTRLPAAEAPASTEAVLGVLVGVLDDLDAYARRARVQESDPRSEDEIAGEYSALDEVIELFLERMEVGVAGEDTRSGSPDGHTTRTLAPVPKPAVQEALALATDGASGDELLGAILEIEDDELLGAEAATDEAPGLVGDTPTRPTSHATLPVARAGADQRKAAELLYEDVLWLFSINDGEGALVSLERMLMLGSLEGEAEEFLRLNGDKLLNLYEGYLGPFTKVPSRGETDIGHMPIGYLEHGLMKSILDMVDGTRSIDAILQISPFSPLETCAGLEQLRRARILDL